MLTLAREGMPFFLRTRKLDITRLDNKPAENLQEVRDILYLSVQDIQDKLKKKEQMFYGFKKTPISEISRWAVSVNKVINAAHLNHLSGSWQLDHILVKAADPKVKFEADLYDINRTRECYRKLKEALPDKFIDIIEDIRCILKYLKKYLLSFYNLEEEETFLDTAATYTKQRIQFEELVTSQVDYIYSICEKFNSLVILTDMSPYARELATKCDCINLPILLVFSEVCESVRIICKNFFDWLNADSNYAAYIKNDIRELTLQKEATEAELKEAHDRYHKLNFKLARKELECDNITNRLFDCNDLESELIIEEEMTIDKANDMQVEIEMKKYRRDEMNKQEDLHPDIKAEKYRLSEQIRMLNMELPEVLRQILGYQNKLNWIIKRKEELQLSMEELKSLRKETQLALETKVILETELKTTKDQLTVAKHIWLYKKSPDAVTKLYLDLPVRQSRERLPGQLSKNDPFEIALQVVKQNLGNSWSNLYRFLPFFPSRGTNQIDLDIANLSQLEARMSLEEVVEKCLNKWRRFSTQCCLEDLKQGLVNIKRLDIIKLIDLELRPREDNHVTEDSLYPYAKSELVPYLKEVDEFDELRRTNKI